MPEHDAVETVPLDVAIRALRVHDRSAAELDARLAERGVGEEERAEALETLDRMGYVDDERVARLRAEQLAVRGAGDALIRHDLAGRGIAEEHIEAALAGLEPESVRAAQIVERRGRGPKTARYLASKGFGEDAFAAVAEAD